MHVVVKLVILTTPLLWQVLPNNRKKNIVFNSISDCFHGDSSTSRCNQRNAKHFQLYFNKPPILIMYNTERFILICRENRKSSINNTCETGSDFQVSSWCWRCDPLTIVINGDRGGPSPRLPISRRRLVSVATSGAPRRWRAFRRKPPRVGRAHHRTSSRGSMSSCSSLKALPWRPTCTALFFTTLLRFFSCLQHVLHFWCLQEGPRASAGTLVPYSTHHMGDMDGVNYVVPSI